MHKPVNWRMKNFKPNHDILALDFDGVISNSINECLVSGHNAFAELNKTAKVSSIPELDAAWVDKAKHIRNFIRNGEDYVYIALALNKNLNITDQDEFDQFKKKHMDRQQEYFDVFFNERLSFAERDADGWAHLSPLYQGIPEFLSNAHHDNLYIITTKKLVFVEKILAANSITLLPKNLHDTSNGLSKRRILENILAEREKTPAECYFIDDQVDTLIKTKPSGVQCILAEWGYNNKTQHDKADEHDIPRFTLKQFIHFFGAQQ